MGRISKRLPDRWMRLPKLKIDPQDVVDLFRELSARKEAGLDIDDGFTEMAFILMPRYAKEPDRIFCIVERALCLKAMMDDERWRGWTIQAREPDFIWADPSLFAATAKCPLHYENDRFHFNPDEFFAIALIEREAG